MSHHHFMDDEGREYGSFEVFYYDQAMCDELNADLHHDYSDYEPGWYWWACFPGCMPDGDATGPFSTEQEAYDDAIERD